MPNIHPFKAWTYNQDKIPSLNDVVSPPYDVISPEDQEALYNLSEHNFVRLILTKEKGEKRYSTATTTLDQWMNDGVVIQDEEEAIYFIEQSYSVDGSRVTRTGIIAELEIQPLGEGILPHEQTIEKHIDDRYKLMESTRTNLGQIFMSYRDRSRTVESIHGDLENETPFMTCTTNDGVDVNVWALRDKIRIKEIQEMLKNTNAIIADGHHRYKTAYRYSREYPNLPGSNRVMVTLVNAYNPGMQVLPTHRILNGVNKQSADVLANLEEDFSMSECRDMMEPLSILDSNAMQFGLVNQDENKAWIFTYKGEGDLLDVAVLHDVLLKKGFNLDTTRQEDLKHFSYLRGTASPEKFIQEESFEWLMLVKPPILDQIFDIAEDGGVMPQKSTFFYPKMYSGIVFRKF